MKWSLKSHKLNAIHVWFDLRFCLFVGQRCKRQTKRLQFKTPTRKSTSIDVSECHDIFLYFSLHCRVHILWLKMHFLATCERCATRRHFYRSMNLLLLIATVIECVSNSSDIESTTTFAGASSNEDRTSFRSFWLCCSASMKSFLVTPFNLSTRGCHAKWTKQMFAILFCNHNRTFSIRALHSFAASVEPISAFSREENRMRVMSKHEIKFYCLFCSVADDGGETMATMTTTRGT